MPIKKTPKPKPQYHSKPPRLAAPEAPEGGSEPQSSISHLRTPAPDLPHAKTLAPRHFELREDGTIWNVPQVSKPADLSGSGSRERDCSSGARAKPEGPSERERASQSPISKSAGRPNADKCQNSEISDPALDSVWTLSAPGSDEKIYGKHPTQKPVALIERCLLASTNPGDLVLDPFLGGGTTAIAALKLNRGCVGIEADLVHITLAARRTDHEIISIWLQRFNVTITVAIFASAKPFKNPNGIPSLSPVLAVRRPTPGKRPKNPINPERVSSNSDQTPNSSQIDLDLFANSINGSRVDENKPQIPTERIFHETKFVFLSCAEVERGAVVHTTVDVSLQEAWAKTPTGKKRETTHIVRCETEILRVK